MLTDGHVLHCSSVLVPGCNWLPGIKHTLRKSSFLYSHWHLYLSGGRNVLGIHLDDFSELERMWFSEADNYPVHIYSEISSGVLLPVPGKCAKGIYVSMHKYIPFKSPWYFSIWAVKGLFHAPKGSLDLCCSYSLPMSDDTYKQNLSLSLSLHCGAQAFECRSWAVYSNGT